MFDRTKCRNAERREGDPLKVRGTCLQLWAHRTVRDELWKSLNPRREWRAPAAPVPLPVRYSRLSAEELAGLQDRAAARAAQTPPAARPADPVLTAWVEWVQPHFADGECCFFTGTYRDDVGYPQGFMLPRNVLRDWRRFLAENDLAEHEWVVAAQRHQERDVLHLHALLADVDAVQRTELAARWAETRGHASAPRLTDGGVAYTTRYALQQVREEVTFEWNLT